MVVHVSNDVHIRLSLLSTFIRTSVDEIFEDMHLAEQDTLIHDILNAVRLHYEYVDSLTRYLVDDIPWEPPNHTRCAFGRIYYSLEPDHISNRYGEGAHEVFSRIEHAHTEFHKIGEDIIEAYRSGDIDKVNKLIFELTAKSRMLIQLCKGFVNLVQKRQ